MSFCTIQVDDGSMSETRFTTESRLTDLKVADLTVKPASCSVYLLYQYKSTNTDAECAASAGKLRLGFR
jgi:hypothetical protein